MNATFAYLLRNLARRRTRTVVGALGIFLTIALLTAIQIGLDSVSLSYIDLVSLQAGKADIVVSHAGGNLLDPRPFDPSPVLTKLQTNSLLRGLSPRLVGIAQVSSDTGESYAVLIGIDPARERDLDISGVLPAPSLAGQTCAVSKSLAEKLKAKPGARLAVRPANGYSDLGLNLECVLDRQMLVPQQIRDYVVVSLAAARNVLNEENQAHLLAGAFRDPRSYYDARDLHTSVQRLKAAGAEIAAELGMDYSVRLPRAAAITAFQEFTSPLRAFFGVFALLALAIAGLLIYSLISVSVEERIREYAILRTLGARKSDILRLVLSESFLLCFIGVVPGALAGILIAKTLVTLISLGLKASSGPIALEISPATLWLTIAGGAVLSIASAIVPALHATGWKIVDALDPLRRGQVQPAPNPEGAVNRPLVVSGLVLTSLSVVVFFVLPNALFSGNPSLIGTVVLCLLISILLGFTLSAMGLIPGLQRALVRILSPLFGVTSELIGRNLQRHHRRHTTTALLFTLSVALVIFIASLVALASRTALSLVEHTHGADLRIHSGHQRESSKPDLALIEGVKCVSQVRFLHSRSEDGIAYDVVASDLVGMKDLWIVPFGVDSDLTRVLYTNGVVWDSGDASALTTVLNSPAATNRYPSVILSVSAARFLNVSAGDHLQLSFRLGSTRRDGRFLIAGTSSSMPGIPNFRGRVAHAVGSGLLLSMTEFDRMTRSAPSDAFQSFYFLKTKGEATAQKAVARRIREEFDVSYRFGVQSTAEQKEQARVLYWATQVFFGLLLAVAIVIAVFALIASMSSTVMERHREIGVLKALGMRRSQLFRLFLGEAMVLTLSAGIAGGIIGFTLAWLFVLQASVLMELATAFTMPYLTFVATLAISIVAGAIAAHLPTRSLLRKSAAEILRI